MPGGYYGIYICRKMAEKLGFSKRSVRNYCAHGRIRDAKLIGKT